MDGALGRWMWKWTTGCWVPGLWHDGRITASPVHRRERRSLLLYSAVRMTLSLEVGGLLDFCMFWGEMWILVGQGVRTQLTASHPIFVCVTNRSHPPLRSHLNASEIQNWRHVSRVSANGCAFLPAKVRMIRARRLVEFRWNEPRTSNPCRLYPELLNPGLN
jgi:hypothetical protein